MKKPFIILTAVTLLLSGCGSEPATQDEEIQETEDITETEQAAETKEEFDLTTLEGYTAYFVDAMNKDFAESGSEVDEVFLSICLSDMKNNFEILYNAFSNPDEFEKYQAQFLTDFWAFYISFDEGQIGRILAEEGFRCLYDITFQDESDFNEHIEIVKQYLELDS